jgi:5'(3')-deoxyribonucleotidase
MSSWGSCLVCGNDWYGSGSCCPTPTVVQPKPKLVVDNTKPTVFFDLDGVLADFDKAAGRILGTDNIYRFEFVYGQEEFWRLLNEEPWFFREMEMLPGSNHLVNAVRHHDVKVLTALPKTNPERVDSQKRAWVRANLGNLPVITCQTHDKPNYCTPGDVLIDDRAVNKKKWEAKGGRFIVHTDVGSTLAQLNSMGLTKHG